MKALVYQGVLEERPTPQVAAPTDALVKVARTTTCGTELHFLKG